jgi:hypothetical protein
LKSELVGKVVEWWDGGAAVMIALLFWIVVGLLVISVSAYDSLDLFIKAFTAVATSGVGIAVWQTTRVFQKATIANADKKLRLDLFDKRLPVWNSFKELRTKIEHVGEVSRDDLKSIENLRREAEMLFDDDQIEKSLGKYASEAYVAAGRPVPIGIAFGNYLNTSNEIQKLAALKRLEHAGREVAELLKAAIKIVDV